MTGGIAVGVQGGEQRGKKLHLPPVRQEVCDPPAGGVRHVQLRELVL